MHLLRFFSTLSKRVQSVRDEGVVHLILNPVLLFFLIMTIWSFEIDYQNTRASGGWDLRNKIVAARVYNADKDPYQYHLQPGDPLQWFDPVASPEFPYTRYTLPPTGLLLGLPFADWQYADVRVSWLYAQWIMLIASALIFCSATQSKIKQKLIVLLFMIFACTDIWRGHIYLGQLYVCFVLVMAIVYRLLTATFSQHELLAGFVHGLAGAIRLPLMILNLPLWFGKDFKFNFGSLSGFLLAVIISVFTLSPNLWQSYFDSMSAYSTIQDNLWGYYYALPTIRGFEQPFEQPIDGTFLSFDDMRFPFVNSSIQYLLRHYGETFFDSQILIVSLALTLILLCIWYKVYKPIQQHHLFLLGSVFILVTEFFLPAPRYSYYDIQWLIPLALIILNADMKKLLLSPLNYLLVGAALAVHRDGTYASFFLLLYVLLTVHRIIWKEGRLPISGGEQV